MSKLEQVFNKLPDNDELFEKWFSEYESADNFLSNINFDDDETLEANFDLEICDNDDYPKCRYNKDLKKIDKTSYDKALSTYKNEKIKEKANDWFYDRQYELQNDFEKHATLSKSGIICYRSLTVADAEEFLLLLSGGIYQDPYTGVGIYWAFDKNKAEAHWSNGKEEVVLKALIPFSAIDQERSFLLNFCPSLGLEEAEIRVSEGSEIIILGTDTETFSESFTVEA